MNSATIFHGAVKDPVGDTSKDPREAADGDGEESEVLQQFREVSRARDSFWIEDLRDNEVIRFKTTKTTWAAGTIFSERQMHDYYIPEASALCVATQVKGPNPGSKAMLRIRQQIPKGILDPGDKNRYDDYTWKGPLEFGDHAEEELSYLNHATKHGCTATPKLIDHQFEAQGKTDHVPSGFRLYILMEKIPGRNLVNFGELEMPERDQVRIAFAKALYEFYRCGLKHEDPHRRNLMWDSKSKKVYIVDLEAATHRDVYEPTLCEEFYIWGLAGVSQDARQGGVDPMVPDWGTLEDHYPSEQELVEMAAAAVGKPTRPKSAEPRPQIVVHANSSPPNVHSIKFLIMTPMAPFAMCPESQLPPLSSQESSTSPASRLAHFEAIKDLGFYLAKPVLDRR
ncbi:hypothetical protein FQN54_002342 [Arachnomyces sp. PD_36]|nr:hypothetical protein FQN54_002342 [Arachnomyces sp. PD_36]